MNILHRYIARNVIASSALVVLVLLSVESLMEFMNQLTDIGVAQYSMTKAMEYVVLQLPTDAYQLFPMAGFLGCLVGLGRLASTQQLMVMRATGVSIAQIVGSVMRAAMVMIVVVTMVGEGIAPSLGERGHDLKAVALSHAVGLKALGGVWLRDGDVFVHVGEVNSHRDIRNVSRFVINSHHQLLSADYAKKGRLDHGSWQLLQVQQSQWGANAITAHLMSRLPLGILFNPLSVTASIKRAEQQSVWELYRSIHYRAKAKLDTNQYEFAFWQRVMQPLATLVMIGLGVPFIFGSLRTVSTGFRVLVGVIVGFAFYTLSQFFGPVTLVYQIPPFLAAALPTVLFATIGVFLLHRSNMKR
ncbi:MAG: LPS export ABC transporter permease LptG [Coxiella sp. RIFCSPHIGHO2_12_FULL_44_14]|nr:MAG: LPS export ABC transporter permease LptG [Coxiella sp. RIFCSPHIGHO2_12_FULL_44_14]